MKRLLRRLIVWKLKVLARLTLRRYHPRIVAVTGSVGKTTTKDLTAAMLEVRFKLRASQGGYNTEFGVPLTILGERTPRHFFGWFGVAVRALWRVVRRHDYPELLVLEMSADKPGDLAYLSRLARPDVAVVTNVQPVHIENYESIEEIATEKSQPVRALPEDGLAILNFDDTRVRMMRTLTEAPTSFYGLTDESNVWADRIAQGPDGLTATIHVRPQEDAAPESYELSTKLLGRHQLSGVLAAFAVAYATGVDPKRALARITNFAGPPGRLQPLPGRGSLTILDDSYNSSPQAALASLEVLREFPGPHRAVLGEMRELGDSGPDLHRMVGEQLGWLDELVTVGPQAEVMAEAAEAAGATRVTHVMKTPEAIPLTADWQDGTALIKGSQNTLYLERVSESLLKDPADAARLNQRLKDPAYAKPLQQHEQA
jgi:UDP-N-acetylmuramoyl-tripeptide--D-alanyl-D-alanine ligase